MRFDKGHKQATRERIVAIAAARFRRDGVAATGIAPIMEEAGLTHGGFYAHFESKEALVRESLDAALAQTRARQERAGAAGLSGRIEHYLSPAHRDAPAQGCAVAALVAEIARHPEATRALLTARLEAIFARYESLLPAGLPAAARRGRAIAIFALLLGTLQLARAVSDPALSSQILHNGIEAAQSLAVSSA